MKSNFLIMLIWYAFVSCSVSSQTINIHDYIEALIGKEYSVKRWDLYHEKFSIPLDSIRSDYIELDKNNWITKKSVNIQISGSTDLGLFRIHSGNSDDLLISFMNQEDSLEINFPIDLDSSSSINIPKIITGSGFRRGNFSIDLVLENELRITVFLEKEDYTVHFWLSKDNGLQFMYSSSDYSNVIGIPVPN